MLGRIVWSSLLPPLAIRVTVLGAVIADPCIWGKPLVRDAASRTKGAAEEDRHGAESRTVHFHSGGNAIPRFGAADNDYAYCSLRHGCLVESRRKQRQGTAYYAARWRSSDGIRSTTKKSAQMGFIVLDLDQEYREIPVDFWTSAD